MRILYIAVHQHMNWGAEYFVDKALRKGGCETICLDFRRHRDELKERIKDLVQAHEKK